MCLPGGVRTGQDWQTWFACDGSYVTGQVMVVDCGRTGLTPGHRPLAVALDGVIPALRSSVKQ
jgi:hypothetical protein